LSEEKKAWKMTCRIIGFIFLSFLPGVLFVLAILTGVDRPSFHLLRSVSMFPFLFLNSLCKPIIYCFRSETLHKTIISGLLVRSGNGENQPWVKTE